MGKLKDFYMERCEDNSWIECGKGWSLDDIELMIEEDEYLKSKESEEKQLEKECA